MRGDAFSDLSLTTVINAAGKMTALGGSAQASEVAAAQAEAARLHVDLQELRDAVARRIAQATGAEAASLTPGAAAGIAISVAACITGIDLARVHALPDSSGSRNRVLIQAAHRINFGAPVTQMIRLGGGHVVAIGAPDAIDLRTLTTTLKRGDTAAMLFVQSHHVGDRAALALSQCIEACHAFQVPLIVDAAAEEGLRKFIAAGVDLVTYSGGKAFGGPTSGFIAGRRDLIAACELQQQGIGRAMKIGKEQIVGLAVAIERYERRDENAERVRCNGILDALLQGLRALPGVAITIIDDEAGRAIKRLKADLASPQRASAFAKALARGNPSIRTRNHHIPEGYVLFDPREISESQVSLIVERVRIALGDALEDALGDAS